MFPPLTASNLKILDINMLVSTLFPSLYLSLDTLIKLPVLGHQAMKKYSHLHLSKVCSNTESHATTKSHEMFRCTS